MAINTPNDDLYLSLSHAVYYNGAFHHPFHANNENIIKVIKEVFNWEEGLFIEDNSGTFKIKYIFY